MLLCVWCSRGRFLHGLSRTTVKAYDLVWELIYRQRGRGTFICPAVSGRATDLMGGGLLPDNWH